MKKHKESSSSKKKKEAKLLTKSLVFLVKTPYYFGRGIYRISKKSSEKVKKSQAEKTTKKKRFSMIARYEPFKLIHTIKGSLESWLKMINTSDSKIGVIIGARGTGKTAFGIKLLENIYSKYKKKCYAMGFLKTEMPIWIEVIESINEINNNSIVLIDEGGILFSSRRFMSDANKLLSDLIAIARHKNLSILFISQNSSNIDINILRQADFLILKPSSLLQKDFERKIIQKIYEEAESDFEKFDSIRGLTYIYSKNFRGFVSNPLPSFWKTEISKSFR